MMKRPPTRRGGRGGLVMPCHVMSCHVMSRDSLTWLPGFVDKRTAGIPFFPLHFHDRLLYVVGAEATYAQQRDARHKPHKKLTKQTHHTRQDKQTNTYVQLGTTPPNRVYAVATPHLAEDAPLVHPRLSVEGYLERPPQGGPRRLRLDEKQHRGHEVAAVALDGPLERPARLALVAHGAKEGPAAAARRRVRRWASVCARLWLHKKISAKLKLCAILDVLVRRPKISKMVTGEYCVGIDTRLER